MKRNVIAEIERWNESGEFRKPLILMGARQVGKTWLMQTFADAHYPNDTVFVDLHDNEALCDAIEESRRVRGNTRRRCSGWKMPA